MHHYVGSAGCRLVGWQSVGALGVHHGKAASAQVAVDASLEQSLVGSDDAARRHLATGSGDGEHHANGQALLGHGFPSPEVPHVAVVGHAVAYGLGGVDHAASTHGEDEVYLLAAAQVDALAHLRQQWVGHHAAQLAKLDAGTTQLLPHHVEQSRPLRRASTIVDEHLLAATGSHQFTNLLLRLTAKHHSRGGIKIEILDHNENVLESFRQRYIKNRDVR